MSSSLSAFFTKNSCNGNRVTITWRWLYTTSACKMSAPQEFSITDNIIIIDKFILNTIMSMVEKSALLHKDGSCNTYNKAKRHEWRLKTHWLNYKWNIYIYIYIYKVQKKNNKKRKIMCLDHL
jgi:hypothetical protein